MFELATTALFLIGTFYASSVGASLTAPEPTVNQPLTLQEYVKEYYKDEPILAEIAKCESRFRQTGDDGRILRGQLSTEDIGIMQINEFYHEDRAKRVGFNLHTLDGNLAYAKWLYSKEGTTPWLSSEPCWEKSQRLVKAESLDSKN